MVIGRGRLGTSVARALGADLQPGRTVPGQARPSPRPGSLVLLAVPDPALTELAADLARRLESEPSPGTAFVHLSGALGLEPLAALRGAGHPIGSLHPLQSFPVARGPEAFAGSLFALEASTADLEKRLSRLAGRLGGRSRRVAGSEQRVLYHAAAVLGSNYLVALAGQATQVLEAAGWDREEALQALLPLMAGVLQSLGSMGLPDALIGPIRRGDPDTVRRHLAALERLGSRSRLPGRSTAAGGAVLAAQTYRMLGLAALELAREAGLDEDAAKRIAEALTVRGSDQEVTDS